MEEHGEGKLTYEDLMLTIEGAITTYKEASLPIYIQDKRGHACEVPSRHAAHVCMFESVISMLNKKGLLKTIPTFKKGR